MRGSMLALLFLVGCGGISDNTLLVDLEPEERTALCEGVKEESWTCEVDGASSTISVGENCEDGFAVTDDCTATVGDWRACDEAIRKAYNEDPCADFPAECGYIFECSGLAAE